MTLDTALKFLKRMAYLHSSVDTLRAKYAELASLLGRNSSLSFLLAEVVESKEDQEQLAEALLHVLTLKHTILPTVKDILVHALKQQGADPNTFLRGNSFSNKLVSLFLKTSGKDYVAETMGPLVTEIALGQQMCFEISPNVGTTTPSEKVTTDPNTRRQALSPTGAGRKSEKMPTLSSVSQHQLTSFSARLLRCILKSLPKFPIEIRYLTYCIQQVADRSCSGSSVSFIAGLVVLK